MAVKTLQQEKFDVQHANEMEVAKRELLRRSHDTVRVYNPLDTTFSFMYDRFWHRVPAKSYKDMDRYLAMKFYKNICDRMIGDLIGKEGEALKVMREKQMGQEFKDKYEENVQIWDKVTKINDPKEMARIFKQVIIGVVEEFGNDQVDMEEQVPEKPMDYRNPYEVAFDALTPLSADTPLTVGVETLQGAEPKQEPPLYVSKKDMEREVLNEDKK